MKYFARLSPGRIVLWCYLLWYLFFVARYYSPAEGSGLWLTACGISGIVGLALLLSTWHEAARLFSWSTFRLFLMPFCVSSFSALVKGKGFFLVFSPVLRENQIGAGLCAAFVLFVLVLKLCWREPQPERPGATFAANADPAAAQRTP